MDEKLGRLDIGRNELKKTNTLYLDIKCSGTS